MAEKKTKKKPKKKMGRPRVTVDWEKVKELLKFFCTGEEIAGSIGVSYNTLERRCKLKHGITFEEFSQQNRGGGKMKLRKKQWNLADNSPAMAIFLGKQYLGQTDKIQQQHTGKDGAALEWKIEVVHTNKGK